MPGTGCVCINWRSHRPCQQFPRVTRTLKIEPLLQTSFLHPIFFTFFFFLAQLTFIGLLSTEIWGFLWNWVCFWICKYHIMLISVCVFSEIPQIFRDSTCVLYKHKGSWNVDVFTLVTLQSQLIYGCSCVSNSLWVAGTWAGSYCCLFLFLSWLQQIYMPALLPSPSSAWGPAGAARSVSFAAFYLQQAVQEMAPCSRGRESCGICEYKWTSSFHASCGHAFSSWCVLGCVCEGIVIRSHKAAQE